MYVVVAYAVVDEYAMVIHLGDAMLANGAVL